MLLKKAIIFNLIFQSLMDYALQLWSINYGEKYSMKGIEKQDFYIWYLVIGLRK